MLVIFIMSLVTACSGDDSIFKNDGTTSNYSEDEIVNMLKGKWVVNGKLNTTYISTENGSNYADEYLGTMEFGYSNTSSRFNFAITETKNEKELGFIDYQEYRKFIDSNWYSEYELLKNNGKYFISFHRRNYQFEITSISKTSFKLVLDSDIISEGKVIGHVYMTMISE